MKRKYMLAMAVLIIFGFVSRMYRAGMIHQPGPQAQEERQPATAEEPALPLLPEKVAQLQLQTFYSGDAAMRDIVRLHNSRFPLADGLVAYYENEDSEMTVWVSVSANEEEARTLMRLMTEKMPASRVFAEKDVFETAGLTVHHVTGMNMDHYYWLDGIYVYWLAVMDPAPRDVLDGFFTAR